MRPHLNIWLHQESQRESGKGGGKGSGSKGSALANIAARLPPVESTATEQTDILELTHEEQEVDATGESVDPGEKISLSDIDWGISLKKQKSLTHFIWKKNILGISFQGFIIILMQQKGHYIYWV